MKRGFVAVLSSAAVLTLAGAAGAGHIVLDHAAPAIVPTAPPSPVVAQYPLGAWKLVATLTTGNPHTDLDYFTKRVGNATETFASVGTLGVGLNGGGQTIIQLTENGQVDPTSPTFVSAHASAECVSNPAASLSLQHDIEATPKGQAILNTTYPGAARTDAQLLLDATDAPGRCHDNGILGLMGVPKGGLELIDITDVNFPQEIHLTSHIGEAHTVNVDPRRPHIAYAVTSDSISVTCDAAGTTCTRANENPTSSQRFNLDGFEVVDMSTCMNFPIGTTLIQKRAACRPEVYRYRYPTAVMALGHTLKTAVYGCHELEVYPNDRLTCGSGQAAMLFDMSGAFDNNGTPTNYLDDKPRGTPLPCSVRASTSPELDPLPDFETGAMVTDCVVGLSDQDLTVPAWLAMSPRPSLTGVQFLGAAYHQGRGAGAYDATQDVDFDHEFELTKSGLYAIATDERGGGVTPLGATCATGANDVLKQGNGGLHAYRVSDLQQSSPAPAGPAAAATAFQAYARMPDGQKAIYRALPATGVESTLCTAHVFHQIPGQNRIFMGWYSQGTQVIDFFEYPDGKFQFFKAGHFIPQEANEWVSAIFKVRQNSDGTYTYWGATGDFDLGSPLTAGRSAIDVYEVTLPGADPVVTLTKKGPLTAKPGSTIKYVLAYKNHGPFASHQAKITDTLLPQLNFVSASGGAVYNAATRTVTWKLGVVPNGAAGERTLTVRVSPTASIGSVIANRANFSGYLTVSNPAVWTTTVVP